MSQADPGHLQNIGNDEQITKNLLLEKLIRRAQSGDKNAFNELYTMYSNMVHGIVLARLPYSDVADVVQEVFITVYKKIHTLRDSKAFSSWLGMIARSRAEDFRRRKRETIPLTETIDIAEPSSNEAEANEILAILQSLPETYRETLILRLVEGMTGPEIAKSTGLTPDSVRVNLHRGMKLLREKLTEKKGSAYE